MPVDTGPIGEDGSQRLGVKDNYRQWKIRQVLPGEPLIWLENWWLFDNKEYRGHNHVLVEDMLWRELDACFPDQLHPLQVGKSVD